MHSTQRLVCMLSYFSCNHKAFLDNEYLLECATIVLVFFKKHDLCCIMKKRHSLSFVPLWSKLISWSVWFQLTVVSCGTHGVDHWPNRHKHRNWLELFICTRYLQQTVKVLAWQYNMTKTKTKKKNTDETRLCLNFAPKSESGTRADGWG